MEKGGGSQSRLIRDATQVSFNSCLCFFTIAMGGKRMIVVWAWRSKLPIMNLQLRCKYLQVISGRI